MHSRNKWEGCENKELCNEGSYFERCIRGLSHQFLCRLQLGEPVGCKVHSPNPDCSTRVENPRTKGQHRLYVPNRIVQSSSPWAISIPGSWALPAPSPSSLNQAACPTRLVMLAVMVGGTRELWIQNWIGLVLDWADPLVLYRPCWLSVQERETYACSTYHGSIWSIEQTKHFSFHSSLQALWCVPPSRKGAISSGFYFRDILGRQES